MRDVSKNLVRKLEEIDQHYESISRDLLTPEVLADHLRIRSLSIKKAAIEPLVTEFRSYRDTVSHIEELSGLIQDGSDGDLVELAKEELPGLEHKAKELLDVIQRRLMTSEDDAVGSIIMEVRAGVGGDEAGIWAGDLVTMYRKYSSSRGWGIDDLQFSPAEHGGFKQAVFSITGEGVWSNLGYEGGTHQVKRVPATEAQGRVHTSTATVAVLPEPEEVEVVIDPKDVKEMITTAQGPGGQNVNKVATAVHLIHLSSNIEVRMQETKSQSQNRQKAWQLLRARLFERQQAEALAERAETRNRMIGGGNRAEKIRTYRYKDNLVVDHRLGSGEGGFNLSEVMEGGLQQVIDNLINQDIAHRLAAM